MNMLALLLLPGYRLRGTERYQLIGKLLCVGALCSVLPAVPWWHAFILGGISGAGISAAHGGYYRLGYEPYERGRDTWAGWLSRALKLERDGWVHNGLALAITGVAFTAPVAVYLLLAGCPLATLALLVAGLSKTLAYDLGWRIFYGKRTRPLMLRLNIKHGTEPGEYLTGLFLSIGALLASMQGG